MLIKEAKKNICCKSKIKIKWLNHTHYGSVTPLIQYLFMRHCKTIEWIERSLECPRKLSNVSRLSYPFPREFCPKHARAIYPCLLIHELLWCKRTKPPAERGSLFLHVVHPSSQLRFRVYSKSSTFKLPRQMSTSQLNFIYSAQKAKNKPRTKIGQCDISEKGPRRAGVSN